MYLKINTGKKKEDRCVTRTVETPIKESIVRIGEERLKVHMENAHLIATEALQKNLHKKTST